MKRATEAEKKAKRKVRMREGVEEVGAVIAELMGLYSTTDDPMDAAESLLEEWRNHIGQRTEMGSALRDLMDAMNAHAFEAAA